MLQCHYTVNGNKLAGFPSEKYHFVPVFSITLADQLFAEGEVIGEAKSIIRTLTKRFQTVSSETTEKVLGLTDLGEIERLADFAYDCQTLHEFEVDLNR